MTCFLCLTSDRLHLALLNLYYWCVRIKIYTLTLSLLTEFSQLVKLSTLLINSQQFLTIRLLNENKKKKKFPFIKMSRRYINFTINSIKYYYHFTLWFLLTVFNFLFISIDTKLKLIKHSILDSILQTIHFQNSIF